MKIQALLLLSSFSCAIHAATPAKLELPVTYHPNAGVVDSVKSECGIEDMLGSRIGRSIGSYTPVTGDVSAVQTQENPTDNAEGHLRVQITHVLGVGGGAWSGPKAITVQAEIIDKDKSVRVAKFTRWSVGGVFGGFKGTCSILERCADAITKDLARWVKNPGYVIPEGKQPAEPAPQSPTANAEAPAIAANDNQTAPATP